MKKTNIWFLTIFCLGAPVMLSIAVAQDVQPGQPDIRATSCNDSVKDCKDPVHSVGTKSSDPTCACFACQYGTKEQKILCTRGSAEIQSLMVRVEHSGQALEQTPKLDDSNTNLQPQVGDKSAGTEITPTIGREDSTPAADQQAVTHDQRKVNTKTDGKVANSDQGNMATQQSSKKKKKHDKKAVGTPDQSQTK